MNLVSRVGLLALLVGVLSGCGSAWKVVRVSGPPSALTSVTDVAVAFDYSQMIIEGKYQEKAWLDVKTAEDPKYPETWADLKGRFENAVLNGVRVQYPGAHMVSSGQGQAVMVVRPQSFQLGKFIPFYNPPTVINANLGFDVGGQITDEINVTRMYPASVTQPSVFNHIGHVGDGIGRLGGAFLESRRGK